VAIDRARRKPDTPLHRDVALKVLDVEIAELRPAERSTSSVHTR